MFNIMDCFDVNQICTREGLIVFFLILVTDFPFLIS